MVDWVGGLQVPIAYDRAPRAAGESKYPLSKMIRFAADAITAFSVVPLIASMDDRLDHGGGRLAFFVYSIVGCWCTRPCRAGPR
jgi:dolichol-phosphate mannosyltransferase